MCPGEAACAILLFGASLLHWARDNAASTPAAREDALIPRCPDCVCNQAHCPVCSPAVGNGDLWLQIALAAACLLSALFGTCALCLCARLRGLRPVSLDFEVPRVSVRRLRERAIEANQISCR